jgi:hypothetical protein
MGQTIEILKTTVIGQVLVIDTDRTLAGQDGEAYTDAGAAGSSTSFPARLALLLLESDPGIDHVFVMSNAVSARRPEGWTPEQAEGAAGIVSEFFRFYPDSPAEAGD